MAPVFNSGNRMRLWGNSYRFSQISDTFDLKRMAEAYDVTVHENNDRAFIAGLRSGGADWSGIYDASTGKADELIASQLGSTLVNVWTVAIEGDAVGKLAHLWRAREKQINITSPAAGRVAVSVSDDATDHVANGRVNVQGTVITTTGARTGVDGGAASALGGVGHFHLTDSGGGSVTVKVQHSSALAGTYADLLTFSSTGDGYAHLETTGLAIKRYTRGIVTAVSGSPFCVAAFARKTV